MSFAAFPHSKEVLHNHHRRVLAERLPSSIDRLPPGRTPFQDALTILDEGGVLLVATGSTFRTLEADLLADGLQDVSARMPRSSMRSLFFGHAHLEQLAWWATGRPWTAEPKARPVLLHVHPDAPRAAIDAAFASWLASPAVATHAPTAVPISAFAGPPALRVP
jgi:hypothetical protein